MLCYLSCKRSCGILLKCALYFTDIPFFLRRMNCGYMFSCLYKNIHVWHLKCWQSAVVFCWNVPYTLLLFYFVQKKWTVLICFFCLYKNIHVWQFKCWQLFLLPMSMFLNFLQFGSTYYHSLTNALPMVLLQYRWNQLGYESWVMRTRFGMDPMVDQGHNFNSSNLDVLFRTLLVKSAMFVILNMSYLCCA